MRCYRSRGTMFPSVSKSVFEMKSVRWGLLLPVIIYRAANADFRKSARQVATLHPGKQPARHDMTPRAALLEKEMSSCGLCVLNHS